VDRRLLKAGLDRRRHGRIAQHLRERAIERYANEGHDGRPEGLDLLLENAPSLEVFGRTEIVDTRARPRHDVGDAQTPFGQPHIVDERQWFGNQLRVVEKLPEAVGRSGKMMPGLGGPDAGVDADEQHAHAGPDAVRQAQILPGRFRILHFRVEITL
jgi:hypothetical protein